MKKLNNKGFSLVELIIVIAIMAILVGVVGTQVIPYLENSRKAKDQQILSAWNTAAVSAYSTEAGSLNATSTYYISIDKNAAGTGNVSISIGTTLGSYTAVASLTAGSAEKKLADTFMALTDMVSNPADFSKFSSKAGKDISNVLITINGGNGQVTTVTTCTNPGTYSFDAIENK